MNEDHSEIQQSCWLPLLCLVNEKQLPTAATILKMTKDKPDLNQDIIKDFLNWSKSKNEIIAYTSYGYCDRKVPYSFDFLINLGYNESNGRSVRASLRFAIWNGLIPMDFIEKGHKYICIIEFEKSIPKELNSLPSYDQWINEKGNRPTLALCDLKDKKEVLKNKKTVANN